MDLDAADLDRRYLELSRQTHPDHQRDATPEQQIAVLEQSARLNDAYRVLSDEWKRAEALLELRSPGVLERTKQLSPLFLAEALELSEEVAEAGDAEIAPLRARLDECVQRDLDEVRAKIAAGEWEAAGTRLHQSRYHRKALRDLAEEQ